MTYVDCGLWNCTLQHFRCCQYFSTVIVFPSSGLKTEALCSSYVWHTSRMLQTATTQKTTICIPIAMKTSNPILSFVLLFSGSCLFKSGSLDTCSGTWNGEGFWWLGTTINSSVMFSLCLDGNVFWGPAVGRGFIVYPINCFTANPCD